MSIIRLFLPSPEIDLAIAVGDLEGGLAGRSPLDRQSAQPVIGDGGVGSRIIRRHAVGADVEGCRGVVSTRIPSVLTVPTVSLGGDDARPRNHRGRRAYLHDDRPKRTGKAVYILGQYWGSIRRKGGLFMPQTT